MNAINDSWLSGNELGVLRLITAGSVDDGKSTLIGRLLYDSKGVFADQLAAVARSKYGRAPANEIDLALLTDGLEAEREQGITIDVAYRYFSTPLRKFIVADAPGHEQYTRNMVTGASTAHVAIILVDASRLDEGGLLTQTKRHSALAQMLGIKHIVVAVNKMDAIAWDEAVFTRIRDAYQRLAAQLGIAHFHILPISALYGDNVVLPSQHSPWYAGPPLLSLLETLPASVPTAGDSARFFVQWVIRHGGSGPDALRAYAGQLAGGGLRVGDGIKVLPSGLTAIVTRILRFDTDVVSAREGEDVSLVLDRDIDVSRGDLLVPANLDLPLTREFDAELCWLDQHAYNPARPYLLKQGTRNTHARISQLHKRRDQRELQWTAGGNGLQMNDIGLVTLATRDPLAVERYVDQPLTGAFILIDTTSHQTVAAGMVR